MSPRLPKIENIDDLGLQIVNNGSSQSDRDYELPDSSLNESGICAHAMTRVINTADELDMRRLFGANQNLTTVNVTSVSTIASIACIHHGWHIVDFELMFDPAANSGQLMGYIDRERVVWRDIYWTDFVRT